MLVYRLCKKEEIEEILNSKNYKKVGKSFKINNKLNMHKYIENKKYLHFFKRKDSILYLNTIKGYYICTYDIPYKLLEFTFGLGYYLDKINFKISEQVEEYAIPSDYMLFEYLVKVDEIIDDIDIDDYLYNNIKNKLTTIYENRIKKEDNNKGKLVLIKKKKYH